MRYSKINNILGWLVFAISLIVYTFTLEPTLSLWDCGEFLVSACKLEINHSPGNPLFMLLGRLFSLLSFGNNQHAAFAVNMLSAVSSAATVMFLFWTITWLISKIPGRKYSDRLVFSAAAIGSLAFAFTDSFWFSAVEAEVYALSSLFTASVLWAATKWEREAESPHASRWIVLVFFLLGLSIGVHLLNLLVIPTAAIIYYFRKYTYSHKGLMATILISGVGVLFLMKIFIPGILELSKGLELVCVNNLGLPVNTGLIFYIILIFAALTAGLIVSIKKDLPRFNLVLLCTLFLLIGYSSYVATVLRSAANPPVDQGNPETTFDLLFYLNREQYGSRPILYGPTFGAVVNDYKEQYTYKFLDGKYIRSTKNPKITYDRNTTGFFPRMHSNDKEHLEAYRYWVNIKGRKVSATNLNGDKVQTVVPTFSENLGFFLKYQLGFMYFRYFMWNFAGRQNDIHGNGELINGNWQSGIGFVDAIRLGLQKNLPSEMKTNKGRNSYYFLPLILGLIGLYFHYKTDLNQFFGMLLLFLILGVGLVLYLNEVPQTPRERDYVYVGSFYVFCIWIAFGVLAIFEGLQKYFSNKIAVSVSVFIGLLAGPVILIAQNYDDHDRSGRYSARDMARNYLESCEKDAILFTHADNDTYPLWYCQEVEGIRHDVRVVVMPYLSAGWYIEQLNRAIYNNEAFKFTIPVKKYQSGETDYLFVVPKIKNEQKLADVLTFISGDSAKTMFGSPEPFIPVDKISIQSPDGKQLSVKFDKRALTKGDIAVYDIIANNWGKRPIYFSSWTDPQELGLKNYVRNDGLVYKLVSSSTTSESPLEIGSIDSEVDYHILMEKCNWENLENSSVYFDWHHRRMFASMQLRNAFYRLANQLVQEGKMDKAYEVLEKSRKAITFKHWTVDYPAVQMAKLYFKTNQPEKGMAYLNSITENLHQWFNYYTSLSPHYQRRISDDFRYKLFLNQELLKSVEGFIPDETYKTMEDELMKFAKSYNS